MNEWENLISTVGSLYTVLKPSRITANLVGMMLFVQVILGGGATILNNPPIIYHLVWGTLTFAVLIVATVLAVREYGSKSNLFRVGVASIAIYVLQIVLGLIALGSGGVVIVVHLTNAFVLGVFVTYLISFADTAGKVSAPVLARAQTIPS